MSRDDTKYKKENNEGFYQELNLIESFFYKKYSQGFSLLSWEKINMELDGSTSLGILIMTHKSISKVSNFS